MSFGAISHLLVTIPRYTSTVSSAPLYLKCFTVIYVTVGSVITREIVVTAKAAEVSRCFQCKLFIAPIM